MPFANIALTDNVVRFATRRYCDNPLIVQGPGAGPEVTAGGVFSDLLRLIRLFGGASVMLTDVTAFAPATVANVGIGFDILGHTVEAVGDRVRLRRIDEPVVRIRSISGIAGDLPVEPAHNTAGPRGPSHACRARAGFRLRNGHREGHPAGSGIGRLGGLGGGRGGGRERIVAMRRCPRLQLLKFAMEGEIVASGSAHIDNIAPCLFGGLTLTVGIDNPRVKQIPVAAVAALRAGASAHVSRHPRGPRHSQNRCHADRISFGRAPIWPDSSAAAIRTIWT